MPGKDLNKRVGTFAVGKTSSPLPLVSAAIVPDHVASSVSHVIEELSYVKVTVRPLVSSLPVFLVVFKKPFILIPDLIDPLSFSIPQSVDEIALVRSPVLPNVLPVTVWLPMQVVTLVDVSVFECLDTVPMLLEGVKLTWIKEILTLIMAVFCYVHPVAMGLVRLPFAHIFLTLLIFPQPISVHHPVLKITNIILTSVLQHSMPMRLVVWKVSKVPRFIRVLYVPFPIFMVQTKLSYFHSINTLEYCIFCYQNSKTVLESILHTPSINAICICDNTKILLLNQFFSGEIRLIESVWVNAESRFVFLSQTGWRVGVDIVLVEFVVWEFLMFGYGVALLNF